MMKRKIVFLFILIIFVACGIYFFNPPLALRLYSKWFPTLEKKNELTIYGNVDIRQVDLGFRVKGRVATMPFQEGDLVTPGTLISMLDKQPYEDLVHQAAAQVESAEAAVANSNLLLERRKILIGTGGISEQDIDDAIAAKKMDAAKLKEAQALLGVAKTNLIDTELYAPSEGTILTRIREPGTVVREADPIYTLSLTSPVWVRAYVSEPQLGLIYPGMQAMVYTDTPGGQIFNGQIGFISPVAEFTPKTVETGQLRTDLVYRLRVIVENKGHELKQGMPVTVKLPLKQQNK